MTLSIGTIEGTIRLRDEFTSRLGAAASQLEKHGKRMERVGRQMSDIGGQLTRTLTLPMVAVGGAAIKMATDLNEGMANVATLIPGNTERVAALRTEIQGLAVDVGKTTADLTSGLYQTISAFGDTADTVEVLEINARAATAGLSTTLEAIDLTSAVTKGYGDTSAEAVQKVADLALMTVRLGQTTFPELASSMGRVIPLAEAVGESQEQMFAVFATATGVVGGASEVATQYRGVINALLKPTADLSALIEEQGFASGEAMLRQLGLVDTLELIATTASSSGKPITDYIAQIEAVPLALALAGPQADVFRDKLRQMSEAAGVTDAAFREQTEGVNAAGFAWKQTRAEIEVALQQLGQELLPVATSFAKVLKPLVSGLSGVAKGLGALPEPGRAVAVAFVGIVAAAGPALFITGQLITAWGALAAASPLVAARIAMVGGALRTLATGPVGLIATAVIAAASVVNEQFRRMAAESARDIDAMVRDIGKLKGALDDLRAAVRRGVITDDEILAARRSLQPLTMELAEIERKLKFSSDRSERDGLLFRKGTIQSEMKGIEGWLAVAGRLPRVNEDITVTAESAAGGVATLSGGATGLTDALADAVKGMQASIATQQALRSSLLEGGDAYEVLNTLLDEGVPLADALSGRYDEMARTLLAASTATETLAKNRERLKELAEEAADAERDLNAAIQETLDSLPSAALGETSDQAVLGFEFDPAEIAPALEAVRNLRLEEDRRRAILQEIGVLLREGTITQREAVKIADQLGVQYSAMSEAVAEMGKQAWRNIQDAAAEAITAMWDKYIDTGNEAIDTLLKSFVRMLAELLVKWAANAAKRAALEQGVAAASGDKAAKSGQQSSSVNTGTLASVGKWLSANPQVWGAAAAAAVVVAWAYWNHKRKEEEHAAKFNEVISITQGGTMIQGAAWNEKQFLELARQAQAGLKAILDAIGGEITNLPDIAIEAQNSGKAFRAIVGGEIVGIAATYEEALQAAFLHAIRQSDLSDVSAEFVNAIKSGAIVSIEQLMEVAAVFQEISSVTENDVVRAMDALDTKLSEMAKTLEAAGISATVLNEYAAKSYQAIRDQITGVTKSAKELFEEQRASFNAEIERRRAELEATVAIEQGKIAALQDQIKLYQMLIAAGEAAIGISADLANKLATAQAALGAAQLAADAAQTALAGLPDLIGAGEFQGGRGRGTRKSDLEQLRDLLDQMSFDRALAGMTELEAGRARLARQYEEEARRAHGNAELIAQLAEEYAFLNAELTRQIQLAAVDTFQSFLGIGEDPFSGLRDRWEQAREAVEEAGFGAERTARMLGRLDGAFHAMLDTLSRESFVSIGDGLMGILETYYGGVEGFEQFRMNLERMRFELELTNLRIQFEALKANGTIAEAVLNRMGEVFDFIDANPIDWSKFIMPDAPAVSRAASAARDVNNVFEEMVRRLASAKEGITDFLLSLQRGDLGGRSNAEMFSAAQAQFTRVRQQMAAGNIQALESFPEIARSFLDIARERFGSTARFQEILAQVEQAGLSGLDVDRVTQDNVVFDERFLSAQRAHLDTDRQGHQTVASAIRDGFAQQSADEERSREDILAELRELRLTQESLNNRLATIEARRRTEKVA